MSWFKRFCIGLFLSLLFGHVFLWDALQFYFVTKDTSSLENSVVLITGASAGIGEEAAYKFASQKARLVITSRTQSKLEMVKSHCMKLGSPKVLVVPLDMSLADSPKKLLDAVVKEFGQLDVLVLNHIGLPSLMPAWSWRSQDLDVLKHRTQTNFFSHVEIASLSQPLLVKSQLASIVVISTVATHLDVPFIACYASTKAAHKSFFASLRQELILSGSPISVSFVSFGPVLSETFKNTNPDFWILVGAGTPETAGKVILRSSVTKDYEIMYPFWIRATNNILSLVPALSRHVTRSSNLQQTERKDELRT